MVFADSAVSLKAAQLRAERRCRGRLDRLHARYARSGVDANLKIQDRAGVYATGGEQSGRSSCDAHAWNRERWDKLAGWIVRSRNSHGVCVRLQCLPNTDRSGEIAEGSFGHELYCRD